MKLKVLILALTVPFYALAQDRPETITRCDWYANKTLGENTPSNQRLLMALVLHTALIGPYTKYHTVKVEGQTGALTPTFFGGQYVKLSPYFDGGYASANLGGAGGDAVNFFGDGGLEAIRNSVPGNSNTSPQFKFFSHVYSYFGTFLGCSSIGGDVLPAYAGSPSMYQVHKFMDLNSAEMGFFVDQAVRGLLSFGFSTSDAQFVNDTLNAVFKVRCGPPLSVPAPTFAASQQSICVTNDCPLSANDTCAAYEPVFPPAVADASLVGELVKAGNGSTSVNASSAAPSASPTPSRATTSGSARVYAGGYIAVGIVGGAVGVFAAGLW